MLQRQRQQQQQQIELQQQQLEMDLNHDPTDRVESKNISLIINLRLFHINTFNVSYFIETNFL